MVGNTAHTDVCHPYLPFRTTHVPDPAVIAENIFLCAGEATDLNSWVYESVTRGFWQFIVNRGFDYTCSIGMDVPQTQSTLPLATRVMREMADLPGVPAPNRNLVAAPVNPFH